jgi:PAS domain S-box-containing protein
MVRFQASLLDQVRCAVIATDLDGKITFWNAFAETLYQYPAKDVLGKSILDVTVPDSERDKAKAILAQTQGLGHWEGQCQVRRKDGLTFLAHVTDAVIKNDQGKSIGGVCVSDAITQGERTDAELFSREELLQTIFDRVPVIISFHDLTGKSSFVNRCFVRTLGWSLEEARTKSLLAEFQPDEAEARRVLEFFRAPTNEWADFRMRIRDGSWIDTSWTCVPLKDGTRLGIGVDLTKGNQTEAARGNLDQELFASRELLEVLAYRLIEAQEAERRNLSRELHDEIGQVLLTVNLNLESLRSKVDPTGMDRLEDSLNVVNTAIEQIRNMTLDLRPASLDLLGLDATLRVYLKRQATRAGLAVEFTSDLAGQRFPTAVETVCFRVVQEALTNVLRHACATHCWIDMTQTDGRIRILIRDDGRGFDPGAAKERALGGEGFGLLGMFERAQLVGGQMEIDSAPGRGTTIRASFPLPNPVEMPAEECA